jgi:hypothetical protein
MDELNHLENYVNSLGAANFLAFLLGSDPMQS